MPSHLLEHLRAVYRVVPPRFRRPFRDVWLAGRRLRADAAAIGKLRRVAKRGNATMTDRHSGAASPACTILGPYPPRACGIATFTEHLATSLRATGARVGVVCIGEQLPAGDGLLGLFIYGDPSSRAHAVRLLSGGDVAIVQHEFAIYGGAFGDDVVDVVRQLTVPSILVCHTVPRAPHPHEKWILQRTTSAASAVVVLTAVARDRLIDSYGVDGRKVTVIAHGATVTAAASGAEPSTPPMVLTWGLLSPGKGIEWMIDAMTALQDLRPPPRYVVAGRPHPAQGETGIRYRDGLVARASARGLGSSVTFDSRYLDEASLAALIAQAAVVVIPYDSQEQVTSGVLVEALAAGRPVVATAFPHAVELLADGTGLLVAHQDPAALAQAVRRVLSEPGLAHQMAAAARRRAASHAWPAVAAEYARIADQLVAGDASAVPDRLPTEVGG